MPNVVSVAMLPIVSGTSGARRFVLPVAVVAWCALIFFASSRPNLLITDQHMLDLVLRKLAHIAEYGVLAVLLSMTLRQEGVALARERVMAVLLAIAYAASDEWHQTFVGGRVGSPIDVGIDSVGAILGATLALSLIDRYSRSSP